jgi:adenylate kinase family enzyme
MEYAHTDRMADEIDFVRLAVYRAVPILSYYEAKGIVSRVDGMTDIAQVSALIEQIIARDGLPA